MKQDWTPQEGEAAKAARNMLRELMEERRWRIPQLADALDISVDIVRRWEQGKSRMQIDDLVAVAKLKGADLNELFGLRPGSPTGGTNVEEIIDRKLENVFGKLVLAISSAVGSDSGQQQASAEPQPLRRRRE